MRQGRNSAGPSADPKMLIAWPSSSRIKTRINSPGLCSQFVWSQLAVAGPVIANVAAVQSSPAGTASAQSYTNSALRASNAAPSKTTVYTLSSPPEIVSFTPGGDAGVASGVAVAAGVGVAVAVAVAVGVTVEVSVAGGVPVAVAVGVGVGVRVGVADGVGVGSSVTHSTAHRKSS